MLLLGAWLVPLGFSARFYVSVQCSLPLAGERSKERETGAGGLNAYSFAEMYPDIDKQAKHLSRSI